MIYTVTMNPSLDYVIAVNGFSEGRINRIAKEKILPGGKGINVSVVLKNLGMTSTALGFVAGFSGEELKRKLEARAVHTDFIQVNEGMTRINIKMKTGAETEINGSGPPVSTVQIKELHDKLMKLTDEDILVLSGNIQPELPSSVYADILKLLSAKKTKVIVDAAGELLSRTLPYKPFLIKPNLPELEELFETRINSKEEAAAYAAKLVRQGAQNVLVSMAEDGAVLVCEDETVLTGPAPKGTVVNSVGAGDSMVAGFLYGFLRTGEFEEAFRMGISAGSASAFSEELATKEEVAAMFSRYTEFL